MPADNYVKHIAGLMQSYETALQRLATVGIAAEAILIHSGSTDYYYADDRAMAFQPFGHFAHWLPVSRPDQFVLICPGKKPCYFQIIPDDFWYDQSILNESWWMDQFQITTLNQIHKISHNMAGNQAIAYIGPNPAIANTLELDEALVNLPELIHFLDFHRAFKTDYELEQLKQANKLALVGHAAARSCFLDGGSEYAIHMVYLHACQQLEDECPYTSIVALNEKAAILHYQNKRRASATNNRVLLIDAGCRINGYCSDVTRTVTAPGTNPVFVSILNAVKTLEMSLVDRVKPGLDYLEFHSVAMQGIAEILVSHELCQGSVNELMEKDIPALFMPHGVGHLLGIQVHDVGGKQISVSGEVRNPPANYPALRNTRTMTENMVFTIEPGFYFIPMLLESQKGSKRGSHINWKLTEELYPLGGIRIEDNVRVTPRGAENLTRQFEVAIENDY
ncbi:MAG TPA: Xaa-Pro dipeptidase [Gammaproteobacteria bacterium]|nr:Xaa-Pro dipeptidase [Gammaproteobacteria bacterium]